MARKKLEDMTAAELADTLKWYMSQIKYIQFLIADKNSEVK